MALNSIFTINSIIFRALACLYLLTTTLSLEEQIVTLKDNICQLDFGLGTIELRAGTSVILRDDNYFTSWTGRYEYSCKFNVKVKDKDRGESWGIYAVIQQMNFRQKDYTCQDYVEFSKPQVLPKLFNLQNRSPKQYCNNLSPGMWLDAASAYEDTDVSTAWIDTEVAPNAYVTSDDTLAVHIHIARERLAPGQKLIFTIAFTAFRKKCSKREAADSVLCRPGECIPISLRNDQIQNCPYTSCEDEGGCADLRRDDGEWPKDLIGSGIGAKVTIGAVTAIILILGKFALCLWVVNRIRRRGRRAAPPRPGREVAVSVPEPDVPESAPTAPPFADIDNKDLPPSYESLFPAESVEMTAINTSQSSTR